jgi:hypothetical protein
MAISGAARAIVTTADLAIYVDLINKGYMIVVIKCERGPLWEPVPIASWDEFERTFGSTWSYSTDPLVLKMGLLQGAKFIAIRVAHCTDVTDQNTVTATCSTTTVNDRGDIPTSGNVVSGAGAWNIIAPTAGSVTGTEVENFTFGFDTADKMIIAVGGGADQPITLSGSNLTGIAVAGQINAASTGLTASVVDGKIKLAANNASDSLTVKTVSEDCYSVLGIIIGVYAAIPGQNSLVVSIDGGADQTFTLTPGIRTSAQVVADLAGLTNAIAVAALGAFSITSNTTGLSSSVQVKSGSTAATLLGFDNAVHSGTAGAAQPTLRYTAASQGVFGDSIKIYHTDSVLKPGSLFNVLVTYDKQSQLNALYPDVSMDPESDRYVVNYINQRGALVQVEDLNSTNVSPTNRPAVNADGVYLSGGSDGLTGWTDGDWVGDQYSKTGFFAADKTDLAMDICIPGSTSITVYQALAAYCEDRGDLIGYGNFPVGMAPLEAKKWRMAEPPTYSHAPLDSHRFCLFYGRPLCYDSRDDSRKNISNLGHFASCLAFTDTNYNESYAPVGEERGVVKLVEGLDFNVAETRGFQDLFSNSGINYLQITRNQGSRKALFWEQFTTQLGVSPFRDLNVVRFMTLVRKSVTPLLRGYVFAPNAPFMWRAMHRELQPAFDNWQAENCIYAYLLQTDRDASISGGELKGAVLNSGLEMDQGICKARALIQPTRVARYIDMVVGATRTGESFATYEVLKDLPAWVRM